MRVSAGNGGIAIDAAKSDFCFLILVECGHVVRNTSTKSPAPGTL